jgi:hypothetical protein
MRKAFAVTLSLIGIFVLSVPFALADSSRPSAGPAPWAPSNSQTNTTTTTQLGTGDQGNSYTQMSFNSNRPNSLRTQNEDPQGDTPLVPVPEPGSLVLLASGVLGLRTLLRTKRA